MQPKKIQKYIYKDLSIDPLSMSWKRNETKQCIRNLPERRAAFKALAKKNHQKVTTTIQQLKNEKKLQLEIHTKEMRAATDSEQ